MTIPWRLLLIPLLLLFPTTLPAAALTPPDFTIGIELGLDGEAAFYELELPLSAYSALTRPDLGDLRVFNRAGAVVPHQLRPQPPVVIESSMQHRSLPFFPLPAGSNDRPAGDLFLHVARNADGTIIDLRSSDTPPVPAQRVGSWLVDLGPGAGTPRALTLSWPEQGDEVLGEVRVEVSSDLVQWTHLTTAAIASLSFQGQHLVQNRILLPPPNGRYLRLSWPKELAPLTLNAIELRLETVRQQRPEWQRRVHRTATDARDTNRYGTVLPGPLPVEEVRLQLTEGNQLAECSLESADSADGPWRSHWRGAAYRLGRGSSEITTPAISVSRTRQRHWRLDCNASEAGLTAPPTLSFAWRPDQLLFLAQGEPPFLLAAGSSQAGPARFPVGLLERQQVSAGRAIPVSERLLADPNRPLRPPAPLPWKQVILWTLLGGGVILIALLAFSLHRQLHAASSKPPRDGA